MASATIQFTQGINVGGSGQSVLGFVRSQLVTLTDAAGPGAISYQWSIVSMPSPLSSAPVLTNATSQVATCTPVQDGVYIVKLIRTDGTGTTVDVRFFGVGDEDGLILPSPGQSGNMHNTGPAPLLAIAAGWAGRADASSNDQLDAYLRFLKSRAGRWFGTPQTINFASGSPTTIPYVDGTDRPFRILNLTGGGLYTEELDAALSGGKTVRYLLTLASTSGGFTLKSGVAGPAILALTAPVSGTASYGVTAAYTGSAWVIAEIAPLAGPSGQVAQTDGLKTSFGFIADANVASGAAIAGTKVSPNFGSQNVTTTGSVQGNALTATTSVTAASAQITGLGANSFVRTNGSSVLTSQVGVQLSDLVTAGQIRGDVAFYNGTNWVRLPAGTNGQVLVTQGTGADPAWTTISTTPSGSAGGDLSGSYPNPTVARINGATVPAAGALTTNTVLMASGVAALTYALIGNANVASGAAIAGTKISPDFGSQNIATTGTIYGSKVGFGLAGPTITTGTGAPAAAEPNGSIFLRTDGTDAQTAFYSRQAGSWFALGGGQPTGAAGGDLSGSYPSPTVARINGATVPASGALTTGHLLQVSGVAALAYGYLTDANVAAAAAIAGTKISPDFGSQSIATTGNLAAAAATFAQILYATGSTPQWASVQQISVAASDKTLTPAEYGRPIIEFTGNTPADRAATFPLVNANAVSSNGSIWYIRNATTGGYNVVVKGVTGLTVSVPFGGSAVVYTDGVNFYSLGSSGAGGGTTGPASGDLAGSYPNPSVAFLSGVGGIVKAVAPFFAIDGTISTAYTFVPDVSTSASGNGFNFVFTGQHGKVGVGAATGGSLQVVGGNAGNATSFGGGLDVYLGNNTYDSVRGGYIRVFQYSGVSGVLQTWLDASVNPIAHVMDTGWNLTPGKKLYLGGTSVNPVTLTGIPNLSFGAGDPVANEPTGSLYVKNNATATTDVFWVRQSSTWASLGAPSGSAGGDLSGTYPNPTVARINGTSVPAGGALTTGHLPMVTGASALGYGYLTNTNVSAAAAIAGTKISPDFGSQTVTAQKYTVQTAGPTVTQGTGNPVTTEPNGSVYLRTDGTDGSNAVWARQGAAWYQVGAGAGGPPTGPAGGDLSGTYPNPTVAKINGVTVTGSSTALGYVLIGTSASASNWALITDASVSGSAAIAGSKISPNFGAQTLTAGKLTVESAGPTITKGAGVPVSASEPNGSVFMRTNGTDGTTAVYSYQAGSWVAVGTGGGATPTGPASGDLSGSYPGPTVAKLNGITAPLVAPSAGQYVRATNATTLAYSALLAADLPSWGAGDLRNTYASPQVVGLTGIAGVVSVTANTIRWGEDATPGLAQVGCTSDHATHDLTIASQAPFGAAVGNKSPGNIILSVPAGITGITGKISLNVSGSEQAYVGVDELTLASATRLYLGGNTLPALFSGVGAPVASAPDGSLYLVRGATGASTTAYVRASGAWSPLNAGGSAAASAISYLDTNTPAFGATNVQDVLDALKSLFAPGGVRLSQRTYAAAQGVSGAQTNGSTTFTGVGIMRFHPSHYFPAIDGGASKRVRFKAYLESTNGLTAEIRLYNLTSGTVVGSTTLTTASSSPVLLSSADISGTLAVAEHDYEVQIRLTGSPTAGDRVTCKMAQLEVTYV